MKLIRSIRYVLVILSALLGLLGLSSTFGYEIIENCFTNNWTSSNQCWDITNESFQYENGYNTITNNMNFTYQGVQDYNTFFLNNINYFLYRGIDNKLHIKNGVYTGEVGNICSYSSNNISEIGAYCGMGINRESTYGCHKNYTTNVQELYEIGGGFDKIYWLPGRIDGLYNNGAGGVLCMIKGNGSYCILLNNSFSPNKNNNCATRYNANIYTGYVQDDSIQNYGLSELSSYFYSSPFNGGGSGGGSVPDYLNPTIVNSRIYDIFVSKGYNNALCYGGYPLSTLLDNSTGFNLQDIVLGSGANIFELYNVYSGGLTFVNWYNTYWSYYTFSKFSQNNYGTFNGKSKGLLGLMAVKDSIDSSFDSASIQNFCRLVINGVESEVESTPIGLINETVNEWQLGQLIGNIGYVPPTSGSNIDIIINSLIDQGILTGYDGSETAFEFFTRYQEQLNSLEAKSGYSGILPSYIILGFLLVFLLYVLKR